MTKVKICMTKAENMTVRDEKHDEVSASQNMTHNLEEKNCELLLKVTMKELGLSRRREM